MPHFWHGIEIAQFFWASASNIFLDCVFEASLNIGLWFSMQDFALEPLLPPVGARPEQVERVLKTRYHDAMTKLQPHSKELDLLIVILPDNNGSLYGTRLEFCQADGGCLVLFLFEWNCLSGTNQGELMSHIKKHFFSFFIPC